MILSSGENLSNIARLIMDEDIDGLEKAFSALNINDDIKFSDYTAGTPLQLAISEGKKSVISWLISQGVNLNDEGSPSMVIAAQHGSPELLSILLTHGADINAISKPIGKSALKAAIYANNIDLVKWVIANGYDLKVDGSSLRLAVYRQFHQAVELLIETGVDVNLSQPDSIFPYNSTPVQVAVEQGDMSLVKLLVKHGADVTIKNAYGDRPFTIACQNDNAEMQVYLKSLEPAQWHDIGERSAYFLSLGVSLECVEFLKGMTRKVEIDDSYGVGYVVFNNLVTCKEFEWEGEQLIDLLHEVDNFDSTGFLVWNVRERCLGTLDYEHEEYKTLGSWECFMADPAAIIESILE